MTKQSTISFDFDGTIGEFFNGDKNPNQERIKDFIKRLIRRGYDVHIITRRYGPEFSGKGAGMEHEKVWKVAQELGISKDKTIFTNREWKYSYVKSIGACMHIDDDVKEKTLIEKHLPEVAMIWLGNNSWEQEMISEIENHDHIGIWFGNETNVFKAGMTLIILLLIIFLFG